MNRPRKRTQRVPAWLKEGVLVDYHSIVGGPVTQSAMRVRYVGILGNSAVAWLENKVGCVYVDSLSLSKDNP